MAPLDSDRWRVLSPYAHASPQSPPERDLGTVGAYRLIRPLGEGGMGIVYLAEQTGPIRREVALKVIKPGLDSGKVLARFALERQILANLNHAGVAKVYDAGAAPDGRPYVAMEYVPGSPLTRFCDERRLSVRARLELFQQVCAAIQHAHQKGVIHRRRRAGATEPAARAPETVLASVPPHAARLLSRRPGRPCGAGREPPSGAPVL